MRIRIRLFLRRFRRWQYNIPLGILVVLRVLLWVLRGTAEELIFSKIANHIPLSGGYIAMVVGLIVGLGIVAILAWMYIDARKEFTSQYLQNTLKEMHKRMLRLKDIKLSQTQVGMNEINMMFPVLIDKLGLVNMSRWDKFVDNMSKQMKRSITERSKRQGTWYYMVAGTASKIIKDLVKSRHWTMADLDIIVDWLDSQKWGLKELRDSDKQWNKLRESIEPFSRDSKLRELISKHISVSYSSCGMLLVTNYSEKWPNSAPLAVLRATLIGSPLNPTKIDLALSEVLGDIDKRMNILKRKERVKASA